MRRTAALSHAAPQMKARLTVILGALCYSTMGAAFQFVDWNPLVITGGRSAVAFLCLAAYRRSCRITLNKKVLIGALISLFTTTAFVVANKLTAPVNAVVLQYTNPLFVLLLCWLVLKRRLKRKEVAISLCMMAGIVLFFADELSPGQALGNLFGLLSGIGMACSIFYACHAKADIQEYTMLMCLISFFGGALVALADPPCVTGSSVLAVVFLGAVGSGISSILYSKSAPLLNSTEVSLLLMLDPILNPLWVALLTGALPGPFALLGGGIVLGCVTIQILTSPNKIKPDSPDAENARINYK